MFMHAWNHSNRIRLIDGGVPGGGSGEGDPKTFTQEQVDAIVESRLAKERGKYKDYEELKAKALKFDEAENAGKSEVEKLREENTALQKRIDDAAAEKQHAEWVEEVSKSKNVPAGLLRGSTREELEAHADLLSAALHPKSKASPMPNQTATPNNPKTEDSDASLRSYVGQLFGRNE